MWFDASSLGLSDLLLAAKITNQNRLFLLYESTSPPAR